MEKFRHLTIPTAAALTFVVCVLAGAADRVRVPGTRTSLEPPKGFAVAERFPGFERADVQSSIMVTEFPAPAAEVMKGMTKEGFGKRGMTLISSKTETVGGRGALLLHVAQNAGGIDFLKWMLVTGDEDTSVMIVGSFPKNGPQEVGAAVRTSVLSASWKSEGATDVFEGLPFTITPTPRLKLAGRMANVLMLTESGTVSQSATEARYVVGSSLGESRIDDLRTFSEMRARKTNHVKDVEHFDGHRVTVGKLPAYELLADAKDETTGTAMRLYQVVAPDGGGYVLIQGLVRADKAAELLPEFRRVTSSFRSVPTKEASRAKEETR